MNDKISINDIKKYLNTTQTGKKICVFDELDSTNNYAKTIAFSGEEHGTVVISETQTSGRGRLGRSFFSPFGTGAYFSIILRPDFEADKVLLITAAASVAVCRALDIVAGVNTQIKWVNDIYLNNKKVCGILTEAVSNFERGGVEFVVVGIGINVTKKVFPNDIRDIATALSEHTDKLINRNELVANVLNEFEKIYSSICENDFIEEYRARSCVIGKKVRTIRADVSREVFVEDIDADGALVVKNEKGETERINSGEISIRIN